MTVYPHLNRGLHFLGKTLEHIDEHEQDDLAITGECWVRMQNKLVRLQVDKDVAARPAPCVVMVDEFLSGWGEAEKGMSVAVWVCPQQGKLAEVAEWVKTRSDCAHSYITTTDDPNIFKGRSSGVKIKGERMYDVVHVHFYTAKKGIHYE